MATEDAGAGRGAVGPGAEAVFRCHGCGVRFPDDAVGPGTCPRCGSIGGHERRVPAAPADSHDRT